MSHQPRLRCFNTLPIALNPIHSAAEPGSCNKHTFACRFGLLQKIRVAKRFDTTEGRRHLVCNRLMAINIFLQSVQNPEQISTFFMAEGELVYEIIALVEADKAVPEPIRTLALKAIAVQVLR